MHRYQSHRSDARKAEYVLIRREYKQFLELKKNKFSEQKVKVLSESINNPSVFWKEIKSITTQKKKENSVPTQAWFEFFKDIFQTQSLPPSILSEYDDIVYITGGLDEIDMNADFSEHEIINAISSMKGRKSPGCDGILNEMLKAGMDEVVPFLKILFQHIFDLGLFPIDWCQSIIVPIHKKGDINQCDNYRPISLTSLVSKIYTQILNKRLTTFTNCMNILPEEQAGFREGYSTVDHIFSLHAMVVRQFSRNRKLYVAFVDFRKCFDSIDRKALFIVLERNGIQGKMLHAIKGIYENVLSAVRNNGEISEYFNCPIGLRQGCLCSTTLFCIFITEISRHLNSQGKHGIQLISCLAEIHHLLFADDTALVADTVQGLQSKLNVLYDQCLRLGLSVNMEKTKIIVFRKGGFLGRHESWHYGENPIEVVNSYRYLGVEFTTRMSFTNSTNTLIPKAKQVCYELQKSLNIINCYDLHIFLKLFDSKVQPIISYASEVWGMHDLPNVEQVHSSALKRFLNVSIHSSNTAIYGETGRFPLYINHKIRCLKYWFKLNEMPRSRIARQAYEMLENMSEKGIDTWASHIRNMLYTYGFGHVWLFRNVGSVSQFCNVFRVRLYDNFKQNWHYKLNSSTHFQCYSSFKSLFMHELYLTDKTFGRHLRNILCKFRIGVTDIKMHRYKFYPDCENLLICPVCLKCKEDEFHVMFVCDKYETLRSAYLPEKYLVTRSVTGLHMLLANANNHFSVAKYLCVVFKLRKGIISRETT